MAHSHCTGPGLGQGPGNDVFLYYTMYCTHYTGKGTGTGKHCFLLFTRSVPCPGPDPVQCVKAMSDGIRPELMNGGDLIYIKRIQPTI